MEKTKLLLIEDDQNLSQTVNSILKREYRIDIAHTARKGLNLINSGAYDLYLIDIMLPDRDSTNGIDICKHIRANDKKTPILIITGKTAINFKVVAFNMGADDYLCKPFNLIELRARIKSLLRRANVKSTNGLLKVHDLSLERNSFVVKRKDQRIDLRRKEFDLLEYLMQNTGQVFSRDTLIQGVWEDQEINHNTVDVHIKNLREKVDKPFDKKLIKTVYGIGYKME
jgi:two-component system response regulator ArlR